MNNLKQHKVVMCSGVSDRKNGKWCRESRRQMAELLARGCICTENQNLPTGFWARDAACPSCYGHSLASAADIPSIVTIRSICVASAVTRSRRSGGGVLVAETVAAVRTVVVVVVAASLPL